MGQPRSASIGPSLLNSANDIAQSQTPSVAGPITLNGSTVVGGVAILDNTPPGGQRVLITTGGAEGSNGTVFTIVGTDWNGNAATETITATNTTTFQSVYDYGTVISFSVNKATAGAITVGTNGVGSSRPIFLDSFAPAPTSLQVDVVGTVSFTVQQSLDDPNGANGYTGVNWVNHLDPNFVNGTQTAQSNYAYVPRVCRVLLNSGSGSVTLTVIQADM